MAYLKNDSHLNDPLFYLDHTVGDLLGDSKQWKNSLTEKTNLTDQQQNIIGTHVYAILEELKAENPSLNQYITILNQVLNEYIDGNGEISRTNIEKKFRPILAKLFSVAVINQLSLSGRGNTSYHDPITKTNKRHLVSQYEAYIAILVLLQEELISLSNYKPISLSIKIDLFNKNSIKTKELCSKLCFKTAPDQVNIDDVVMVEIPRVNYEQLLGYTFDCEFLSILASIIEAITNKKDIPYVFLSDKNFYGNLVFFIWNEDKEYKRLVYQILHDATDACSDVNFELFFIKATNDIYYEYGDYHDHPGWMVDSVADEPEINVEEHIQHNFPQPLSQELDQIDNKEKFIKIYQALYQGQTSFFKRQAKNFEHMSFDAIKKYAESKAHSRSSTALLLLDTYKNTGILADNIGLVEQIHKIAYQKSGFFKKSAFKLDTIDRIQLLEEYINSKKNNINIEPESSNRRIDKILKALK